MVEHGTKTTQKSVWSLNISDIVCDLSKKHNHHSGGNTCMLPDSHNMMIWKFTNPPDGQCITQTVLRYSS